MWTIYDRFSNMHVRKLYMNSILSNNNNNNNFISIALLSYVQGTLQSLLKNIYKFTTISYYIYNG